MCITANILIAASIFDRPVSKADISNTEKRLLQTIDMIINKKKRIALATQKSSYSVNANQSKPGLWGFLKTVSDSVTGSGESNPFDMM